MALDNAALLEVLEAMQAAGVEDRVRTAAQTIYQALIDAELTSVIGAGPWERSEERTAQRNGSRPRLLSTAAGDIELSIPKLRTGSFFPSLLERRRRIDRALFAVVMEAYVHGVSTRKVDDLVKALGVASGISKSEVSRICAELDRDLKAFRDSPEARAAFFQDVTRAMNRFYEKVMAEARKPAWQRGKVEMEGDNSLAARLVDGISHSANDQVHDARDLVAGMQRLSEAARLILEEARRMRQEAGGLASRCQRLGGPGARAESATGVEAEPGRHRERERPQRVSRHLHDSRTA